MKTVKIKSIKKIESESKLYDIEVEGNHNFFTENILVHNCSATFEVNKRKNFRVYSHNVFLGRRNNSNWWNIAIKYNIENEMKKFMKINKIESMAIQGEVIGEGIQRNLYKIKGLDFYVFNVRLTKLKLDYNLTNITRFCKITGMKQVPLISLLKHLPETVDEIILNSDGMSVLKDDQLREGLVWRSHESNPKVSFKAKSQKYQIQWNKKDKTE